MPGVSLATIVTAFPKYSTINDTISKEQKEPQDDCTVVLPLYFKATGSPKKSRRRHLQPLYDLYVNIFRKLGARRRISFEFEPFRLRIKMI